MTDLTEGQQATANCLGSLIKLTLWTLVVLTWFAVSRIEDKLDIIQYELNQETQEE